MALSEHVLLTITEDSVGVARAGFGVPLILAYNVPVGFTERVRTYTDFADLIVDFPATDDPTYIAAQQMFAQDPHPTQVKVGRGALPPTKRYTLSVVTVRDSHDYQVTVRGEGFDEETVTYTSDASATDAEIAAGLVSAINAVVGNNYVAAGATSPFTVTADAAADYFTIEVLDPTDLSIAENHADPGVATDLAAILLADSDWYGLHTMFNSDAYVKAAAAFIESNKKLYVFDVNETEAITDTADGTQGTLDDIAALSYSRVAGCYHPRSHEMLAAAMYGRTLPLEPGSETWAYKTLSGVTAATLTSTHRTNLDARNATYYKTEAGIDITWQGKTSDGDYIDITRGLDWLEDDMTKSVFEVLAGLDKVPFTDAGVALIEAEVRGSLRRAVQRTILSDDPAPTVTVPRVADVSTTDKAARRLPDVKFSATLAGAIHKVVINGVVSV